MARMKTMQIGKPGADFELVERVVPEPGAGEVRIKVEACGVCHSDVFVKEGVFPDIDYPRVPGHEVAGRIDKLGPGVTQWEEVPGAEMQLILMSMVGPGSPGAARNKWPRQEAPAGVSMLRARTR